MTLGCLDYLLVRLWTVCDASSADYQTFNISLGEQQLLEPLKDLCTWDREWPDWFPVRFPRPAEPGVVVNRCALANAT